MEYAKKLAKEHWITLFNELNKIGKLVVLIGAESQNYTNLELPDNVVNLIGKN